ncbi:conserved membrane hypothetical protein [Candidatus Sulfopaludibacter sp. SbA4]|nr:conserved membrane hypothetical protein [Candidatus Sulfopaludibacter sp. SbA4]
MAFCATCGSQVEGKFCAKCGSPVAAASPGPAGPGPQPQPMAQPMVASGAMADNVASALCYLLGFITGIIFLVIAPYNQNKTVRFHAFQSIFANVALIAIEIALSIVFSIMYHLVSFLALLGAVFFPVLGLGCFLLWLYLMFSAYQGKMVVLPIIGPFAQQQA